MRHCTVAMKPARDHAVCMQLGISREGYNFMRKQYRLVSEQLQLELFPPLARISRNLDAAVKRDASGLYAIRAVGKTGRLMSVRAPSCASPRFAPRWTSRRASF